ncbi:MAG: MMPL family transporter, partial [Myxococcota bacterium]|nr:MMPL family transporter [Myxococcota bacterium]
VILVQGDVFSLPFLKRLSTFQSEIAAIDVEVRPPPRKVKAVVPAPAPPVDDDFQDDDDEGWGDEEGGSIIDRVTSVLNVRQTRGDGGRLRVEKLMTPLPTEAALPALKTRVLADPLLVGNVVGPNGQLAIMTAYAIDMYDGDLLELTNTVRAIAKKYDEPGFRILVTGPPAIASTLNDMVIRDMSTLGTWSLVVIILALVVLFRHFIGVFAPIVVVGISVVWALGFMAIIGFPLTILSGILPAFLFCVGVGDSIHMLSIYRDRKRYEASNDEAIIDAVSITGPPVFFTSLTTTVGLLSLGFASVPAIVEMGISGGFGVLIAFLMSIWVLPILLTFDSAGTFGAAKAGQRDWLDRFVDGCLRFSTPHRGRRASVRVMAVALCLSVVAAIGVSRLEVMHDDLETVPDGSDVKQAATLLDARLGGVATAELMITPTEGTMKDLALLQGLEKIAVGAKAYRDPDDGAQVIMHTMSLVDIAKETLRALTNDDPSAYRLPNTQTQANEILELFGQQSPAELKTMTTIDWSQSHMTLRAKWREATTYEPFIRHVDELVKTHIGDRAKVEGTGPVYIGQRIVAVLLEDLLISFATAFLFVSILMVILLRDLKLGLVAMLPNLFPIALVLGCMGLSDIPIDLNNLLLASIALGIAVDDTVHFLHHFQSAYRVCGDRERALHAAKHHAGRAMLTTSIILVAGFGAFVFALNIALMRFGILIALTVLSALLVDLIVLPALLRLIYPDPDGAGIEVERSGSHPAVST